MEASAKRRLSTKRWQIFGLIYLHALIFVGYLVFQVIYKLRNWENQRQFWEKHYYNELHTSTSAIYKAKKVIAN